MDDTNVIFFPYNFPADEAKLPGTPWKKAEILDISPPTLHTASENEQNKVPPEKFLNLPYPFGKSNPWGCGY